MEVRDQSVDHLELVSRIDKDLRPAARLMQKAGILSENINLTSDLSVNPSTVDLGQAYKGQTVVREVSVNGFDLVPAEGNVSITASNGLKVSADGNDYSSIATLAYKEGNLIGSFKTSYEFATAGDINESITVSCGDKTVTIPVVGKCVELADGVAASAYWRLEKDDNCTVEGPVDPVGETYSEMKLQKYSSPNANTTWPEGRERQIEILLIQVFGLYVDGLFVHGEQSHLAFIFGGFNAFHVLVVLRA